ncbi:MAG: hypothetical protein V3T11_09980 [Roseateles sp.]
MPWTVAYLRGLVRPPMPMRQDPWQRYTRWQKFMLLLRGAL